MKSNGLDLYKMFGVSCPLSSSGIKSLYEMIDIVSLLNGGRVHV